MTRSTTNLKPRPGVTLIEVLVAIFVMAIGLMALLTLFPLGALNMAQAIKDDRTGNAAQGSAAVAHAAWRDFVTKNPINPDQRITAAMTDPATPVPPDIRPVPPGSPLPPRKGGGTSYPVFVDPIGYTAFSGNHQFWVGGQNTCMPRCSLDVLANNPAYRDYLIKNYFTALDDINFGKNGLAETSAVQREGRYSWGFVLRRPRASDVTPVEVTVVVFSGRSLDLSTSGSLQPLGETAYQATFFQGNRSASLYWAAGSGSIPQLRDGGWILDGTMMNSANPNDPPHGYFYRISNYTDPYLDPVSGLMKVDLELRNDSLASTAPIANGGGIAVVMPEVVEVFEKGSLDK